MNESPDEESFRKEICGKCKYRDVCSEWEFATLTTLYKYIESDGVFRCACFEEDYGEE